MYSYVLTLTGCASVADEAESLSFRFTIYVGFICYFLLLFFFSCALYRTQQLVMLGQHSTNEVHPQALAF